MTPKPLVVTKKGVVVVLESKALRCRPTVRGPIFLYTNINSEDTTLYYQYTHEIVLIAHFKKLKQ
jgi:hypothetical protein